MLHQVGVSFVLYCDARKHKIKKKKNEIVYVHAKVNLVTLVPVVGRVPRDTALPPVHKTGSFSQLDRRDMRGTVRLCSGGLRRAGPGCIVLHCNVMRG